MLQNVSFHVFTRASMHACMTMYETNPAKRKQRATIQIKISPFVCMHVCMHVCMYACMTMYETNPTKRKKRVTFIHSLHIHIHTKSTYTYAYIVYI